MKHIQPVIAKDGKEPSTTCLSGNVFAQLAGDRIQGTLKGKVSTSAVNYQLNRACPLLLEQVHRDGTRVAGYFTRSRFFSINETDALKKGFKNS